MAQGLTATHSPLAGGTPACEIVVPVFNGFELTGRCLESLARHTPAHHGLVLVDDASDDPRVLPLLQAFVLRRKGALILANERNRGFVQSVNRALASTHGDVIVLNSDTEVTPGWVEGMLRCRDSDPAIGMVCPLSDEATILSLTGLRELYRREDGSTDIDALAACVKRVSARTYPRIPTAVGFCMLLTRRLLDRAGHFDPVYGRGYGEENDLSMRALDLGFEIACADDVFVHHSGGGSFGSASAISEERQRNHRRLERRWPAYLPGVSAWSRANPLRRNIERINAAAERERFPGRPRVLQVLHRLESRGGIEEHTRAMINELKNDACFTVVLPLAARGAPADLVVGRMATHLRIARLNFDLARHGIHIIGHPANVTDPAVEEAFANFLAGGYDVVHFQSLVGWNSLQLPRIARDSGARVVLSVHDMSLACADYNMMSGAEDRPCGRIAARGMDAGCVQCLRGKSRAFAAGLPSIATYIEERHAAAGDLLDACDAIVCPSDFARARLDRAFAGRAAGRAQVIPHGVADHPLIYGKPDRPMLRVAFIGRFCARKGAAVLIDAARLLAGQRVVFEIWGQVDGHLAGPAAAQGMLLRGMYAAADLPRALRGIDLVVVPSTIDETFCLVLSEAQRLGIPVAASRNGAMPERIREGETGFLFPVGDSRAVAGLLLELRDDRGRLVRVAERLREERPRTVAACAADYLSLYRSLATGAHAPSLPSASGGGGDDVRRWLGFPRARRASPLGTDEYDEWMAREASAPRVSTEPEKAFLLPMSLPRDADEQMALLSLNRAIAASPAPWIAIGEDGDRLEGDALPALAAACRANPRAWLVYCDDDAVSAREERYDPAFKPGFDAALLRHLPYIAGLCAISRERVVAAGGLRAAGWPGIVDFALQAAETGDRRAVVALRALLCHRLETNLRALESAEATQRFQRVVGGRLRRHGSAASLVPMDPGRPLAWAHAGDGPASVSAFVHSSPTIEHAAYCVDAMLRSAPGRFKHVLLDLDDARCMEIAAFLARNGNPTPLVSVHDPKRPPLGMAIERARTEWLVIVDARCGDFTDHWLERLEQGIDGPFTGAIAPDLLAADGERLPGWEVLGGGPWSIAGMPPPLRGSAALNEIYGAPRSVSALASRLMMVRRAAAADTGALDDMRAAGRYAVTHLGLALNRAGHRLLARPFVAASFRGETEMQSAPASPDQAAALPADVEWMRARWPGAFDDDPHFHPALALTAERMTPAPRFPPRPAFGDGRIRICAFPFDRWGSGELRVRQPVAMLERAGDARIVVMAEHDSGRTPNRLELERLDPDTILAHNFFHDYQLRALAEYARGSSRLRVLGMDDLLTDIPRDNPFSATIYRDIARRIAEAVSMCDRLVVSTEALAKAYGAGAKDVRVIPNAIDEERWKGLANTPRAGPRPRIGWAGAKQHLGDLRLLEPVVVATHGEIDWIFLGLCPASIRNHVREFHDMVPIARYPGKLASLGLDAAVAPLEDHPFNRAKSNLRILEYGILGIPVVASALDPYQRAPVEHATSDPANWIERTLALARDRERAREQGEVLRRWVLANFTLRQTRDAWKGALDPTSA